MTGLPPKKARQDRLVDWSKTTDFLKRIQRDQDEIVLSVFPPEPGPNIHFPCKANSIPQAEIERALRKYPSNSLGLVVNPALPKPENWGTKKEHLNKQGLQKAWGASNPHISGANALFTEGDSGLLDPDTQYSALHRAELPPPSMTIWTGGKSVHFYWLLSECISPDKFREMQKRIAKTIEVVCPNLGVDQGLSNPNRVMRIPGGFHGKTKNICALRSYSGVRYQLKAIEQVCLPLADHVRTTKGFIKKGPIADRSWFDRRSRDEQHQLAVEMLGYIPKREKTGEGERSICISVLYGLKNHFGESEAGQICEEAQWFSANWDPIEQLPTLTDPTNTIGTLIENARQRGWQLKVEAPQKKEHKITLDKLFPGSIVEALRTITKYLPYPDTLIATTYMAGCSALLKLGSSVNLQPLTGFKPPLNLYVCTCGKTGTKKTPLQKLLIDFPLSEVFAEMKLKWGEDLAVWNKQPEEDRGPKPPRPLLTIKNSTEEGLQSALITQEEKRLGLLLCADELAGVFKSMNQYTQGRGSAEEQLLELYDGGGFEVVRANKKHERFCDRTHFSIYGGIQPEVLAELQKGKDHNGKWARFLFSHLPPNPTKLPTKISPIEKEQFEGAKRTLQVIAKQIRSSFAWEYQLDDQALKRFSEYEYQKQMQAVKASPFHAAILNKSAGKVGRVAGLLHVLHTLHAVPPEEFIGLDRIEAAIELVDYLDSWAMNFQTDGSRSTKTKWMKRLHELAAKAKNEQGMAWTEISQSLSGKEKTELTPELKEEVFAQLVEAGLGKRTTGKHGGLFYKALHPWFADV